MITETKVKGFDTPLKYTKLNYPKCTCNKCPHFYFNALLCGVRQSGKTYSCCQLIKHYEINTIKDPKGQKYDVRSILISPTSSANPVYKSLESLNEEDIYDEYSDSVLQGIMDEVDSIRKETEDYNKYVEAFKAFEKLDENTLYRLKDEYLIILSRYDFAPPDDIPQPRYKNPVITIIILDDLLGSDAFNKRNQNLLKYYYIRNRHKRVCFCILTQSIKAIPKDIRLNSSVFWYGCFRSKKAITEDLYDEVSDILTPEEFIDVFEYATKERYGSLVIDASRDEKVLLKNFDKELKINI